MNESSAAAIYPPLFLHSFYCISLLFTSTYRINFLHMYRTISFLRDKIAPLTESQFLLFNQCKSSMNQSTNKKLPHLLLTNASLPFVRTNEKQPRSSFVFSKENGPWTRFQYFHFRSFSNI